MTTYRSDERISLYRARADEARSKADRFVDVKAREVLLEVAATWERLADLESQIPQLPSD